MMFSDRILRSGVVVTIILSVVVVFFGCIPYQHDMNADDRYRQVVLNALHDSDDDTASAAVSLAASAKDEAVLCDLVRYLSRECHTFSSQQHAQLLLDVFGAEMIAASYRGLDHDFVEGLLLIDRLAGGDRQIAKVLCYAATSCDEDTLFVILRDVISNLSRIPEEYLSVMSSIAFDALQHNKPIHL